MGFFLRTLIVFGLCLNFTTAAHSQESPQGRLARLTELFTTYQNNESRKPASAMLEEIGKLDYEWWLRNVALTTTIEITNTGISRDTPDVALEKFKAGHDRFSPIIFLLGNLYLSPLDRPDAIERMKQLTNANAVLLSSVNSYLTLGSLNRNALSAVKAELTGYIPRELGRLFPDSPDVLEFAKSIAGS